MGIRVTKFGKKQKHFTRESCSRYEVQRHATGNHIRKDLDPIVLRHYFSIALPIQLLKLS